MEVLSAIVRGEAQIVDGVLVLAYYIGLQEMDRLPPPQSVTGF